MKIGEGIASSGINKAQHYNWVKPGDKGRQCVIPLIELRIDHAYQRPEVSDRNTLAIASRFNWVAFNSIVVMERENGDKYVVDGQQRLLAAKRRGDIHEVPCVMFRSDGREHEARAFISLNVRRTNVPAVAKFKASVRAALNPEKQIADWLEGQGLAVTENGKDLKGVDFPTCLMQTWKIDDEAARLAIQSQRDVNGTEPLHSICHKGIWWLFHNEINVFEHAKKLKQMGGLPAILRSVKMLEIETGAYASVRGCGIGVLRLINHKRRGNKIAAPEEA